jgi:aryl-alcohol dehydrogenase-like predicted oxidoreductase
MQYRRLGRLTLHVSPLCLGTMNFGWREFGTAEPEAHQIMDEALEAGINFFDTADMYGDWEGDDQLVGVGATEEIIGRWFAKGGGRRERVVLATKVFNPMSKDPNDARLSALHIRKACDESLRRLQTDYIDLYQMHRPDQDAPWDEIYQAMDLLVSQGKVLYVGSSNFAGWQIAKACEAGARRNSLGLVSEQCCYSLTQRNAEREILPACQDYGLGVLPWSPLDGGLLAGAATKVTTGRRLELAEAFERHGPQLERYTAICAELGEKPAVVALAWLLHNPVVTAPVIGSRTVAQLKGALRATELQLASETLAQLDEIFPGDPMPTE